MRCHGAAAGPRPRQDRAGARRARRAHRQRRARRRRRRHGRPRRSPGRCRPTCWPGTTDSTCWCTTPARSPPIAAPRPRASSSPWPVRWSARSCSPRCSCRACARPAPGRVITMSSGGMYASPLRVSDLQMGDDYKGTEQYARAKRAQVTLNEMWAARVPPREVVFHAMHPGWADTPGVQESLPTFRKVVGPLLRTPAAGRRHVGVVGGRRRRAASARGSVLAGPPPARRCTSCRPRRRATRPSGVQRAVGLGGRRQRRRPAPAGASASS